MTRADPAAALRVSSLARSGRGSGGEDDDDRPRLRLLVQKGLLGVELDAPFVLGPLVVDDLALSFSWLRFPIELSGGLRAFRNKRGELDRLRVLVPAAALQRWAAPRLARVLAGELVHHVVAPLGHGWLVGLATEEAALAFEVVVAPLDGDLRLIPVAARGAGLGEAPIAAAARALAALARPLGRMAGSAVILERAPVELSRALLPLAGMRAADGRALRWTRLVHDLDGARLEAAREGAPFELAEVGIRAVELAALAADAEHALLRGDAAAARHAYLDALARAPRHRELALRLAALDRAAGERDEAALSVLADVVPAIDAGTLGAELLARVGDADGARSAWRRAAEAEPYSPLAAHAWLEVAQLSRGDDAGRALDEAVARAPMLTRARWRRFEERAARGLARPARADLEHLEAQASGPAARHEVLRRAAEWLLERRLVSEASEVFERALRYAPASADAVAGLARSLSLLGHRRRALELLGRAAALAERARAPSPRIELDLAEALVTVADDRPAAIARVRSIEQLSPACYEARLLEARWRAELGDLAGASAALARLAEAVEAVLGALLAEGPSPAGLWSGAQAPHRSREEARVALAAFLEEGARIHELDRDDPRAALALLETAQRLAPRRETVRRAYERLARRLAAPPPAAHPKRGVPEPPPEPAVTDATRGELIPPRTQRSSYPSLTGEVDAIEVPPPPATPLLAALMLEEAPDAGLEARVEELTDRLRGNPRDAEVANQLADALEALGRNHELFALLAARLDEGAEEERPRLVARRRAVLERLAAEARAAGRNDEAELYALMLEREV
jgi:cellulose synthase operon protein C